MCTANLVNLGLCSKGVKSCLKLKYITLLLQQSLFLLPGNSIRPEWANEMTEKLFQSEIYTDEQYHNMVYHVDSSLMDTELHAGRIRNHLQLDEKRKEHFLLYEKLLEKLHEAMTIMNQIEDLEDYRSE